MKLRDLEAVRRVNERRAEVISMIKQVEDDQLVVKLGSAFKDDFARLIKAPVLDDLHGRLATIDGELRAFGVELEEEVDSISGYRRYVPAVPEAA